MGERESKITGDIDASNPAIISIGNQDLIRKSVEDQPFRLTEKRSCSNSVTVPIIGLTSDEQERVPFFWIFLNFLTPYCPILFHYFSNHSKHLAY